MDNLLINAFILEAFFKVSICIFAYLRLRPLRKEAKHFQDPLSRILDGFMLMAVGFGLSDIFDFLLAATSVEEPRNIVVALFLLAIFLAGTISIIVGTVKVHTSVHGDLKEVEG